MNAPSLPPISGLSNELWDLMAQNLEVRDLVLLSGVNKSLREISIPHLKNLYQKTFGKIDEGQEFYPYVRHLHQLNQKHPHGTIGNNVYKAPSNFSDRWKWILGVNNNIDQKMKENYDRSVQLLENTQPTSIIQLKNKLQGFWQLDRYIKDYENFKKEERARVLSGKVKTIFLGFVGFLLKIYYGSSTISVGKKLELRSKETFAKIGQFKLDNKDYDVVAFHCLADEQTPNQYPKLLVEDRPFHSVDKGLTQISIVERQQPHHNSKYTFSICLGRELANRLPCTILMKSDISSEDCSMTHGYAEVLKHRRYLVVNNRLPSRDKNPDRSLVQKLNRILIEMILQNKNIIGLWVDEAFHEGPKIVPKLRSEPILNPKSGILPEYWARAPKPAMFFGNC